MSAREILDLKHGLQAGQVVPYFQPQIDLRTGQVCRFEALARWHHPVHGLVGPDVFIPLAEAGDLIGALTEKVVSAAATIAVRWPESVKLAVNVSPLELRDWSLPDRLQSAVQKTGFPMNRLVVEITESALVGNVELAQPIAADLKQAGASLALDDFGTGSSSLHHLQALPFDEIKVDASFVRSMEECRQSRKIVAAVVGLGNSLGLTTVAEGVEEQVQADILVCLGCDYGQGWLFGHAVPPGELDTDSLKSYPRDRVRPLSGSAALQLEARPAERRAQLQAIYDGAPVGLCFLDRSLRYVSLNRHLADMHGIPLEDHLGRTVSEVLPHLEHQLEPHLHRALAGEAISNIEVQLPHGDMTRVLLLSYQPARDEVGDVVGISIAALDMTERR